MYCSISSEGTPSPDGSMVDSDCSQGTLPEKHTTEEHEKALKIENDMDLKTSGDINVKSDTTKNVQSFKRGSDTSPSDVNSSEQGGMALPRKKVKDLEDSIHTPDSGGMSIKDFMESTRIKGKKGLVREYEKIKIEPPKGTFDASK